MVFPPENRAQMIDDAFTLASTGNLSHDIALNLTLYLENERHLLPWDATLAYTDYISDMFRSSGGFGELQLYMQSLLKPVYDFYGWNDSANVLEQFTINEVIKQACFYRYEDCLERASSQFMTYMQDPSVNPISNNLKTTVYCNGIREGGQVEWDFGWDRYLNTSDSSEKSTWIYALGCSRYPWILNRYLSRVLEVNSRIRSQDVWSVIGAVASNHFGVTVAWDFVRANWDVITDLFGGNVYVLSSIVSSVTANFNSQQELEELVSFGEGGNLGASRAYEQAIEKTMTNIRWMTDYEDVITEWLRMSRSEF